jgi:putative hydrolase of the HAD superfamily
MPAPDVDIVLFDLGGVLFDFGGVPAMKKLAAIDDDEEVWSRWLTCRWVRAFERGDCSPDAFAAGVVADWELPIDADEFLASFRSWLGGPLTGAEELVADTKAVLPVGCLSNTNSVHWADTEGRWSVLHEFDVRFLSFEMGCVKPDREIFERVAEALACAPSRILFLDDNRINTDAAQAADLRAVHAKGVDEARRALVELGVLQRT